MSKYEEAFRERRLKLERIKKRISDWHEARQIENYNHLDNRSKSQIKLMSFLIPGLWRKPN
jgi:hypothetical protein